MNLDIRWHQRFENYTRALQQLPRTKIEYVKSK